MKYYLGIDLGGTNIATGIIDENYQFVARHSVPTKGTRPFEVVVRDIAAAARAVLEKVFDRLAPYMRIAHAKDCKLAEDVSEKHADIDADESHSFRGSGDVELPAAGLGSLNYDLYVRLLAKHHPNMPLIIEHLDEGGIPRAKEFVDGVLKNAGV